jgi:hypothetical protein
MAYENGSEFENKIIKADSLGLRGNVKNFIEIVQDFTTYKIKNEKIEYAITYPIY